MKRMYHGNEEGNKIIFNNNNNKKKKKKKNTHTKLIPNHNNSFCQLIRSSVCSVTIRHSHEIFFYLFIPKIIIEFFIKYLSV